MVEQASPVSNEDVIHDMTAAQGRYFVARTSGLYHSNDDGITWQPSLIALNLEQPATVTAVTTTLDNDHNLHIFAGLIGGVVYSHHDGASWHITRLSSPPPVIAALVASPQYAQDGLIIAATLEDGIFRSEDGGQSWQAWNFGLLDRRVLSLVVSPRFANDRTVFAGTETGIYRSRNAGRSWQLTGFPDDRGPLLSLAMSGEILLAGTEHGGLLRTTDHGDTWQRLGEGTIIGAVNRIILAANFRQQPHLVVLHDGSLRVSWDGGQTWDQWPGDAHAIATAMLAPHDVTRESHLLVGIADGRIVWV